MGLARRAPARVVWFGAAGRRVSWRASVLEALKIQKPLLASINCSSCRRLKGLLRPELRSWCNLDRQTLGRAVEGIPRHPSRWTKLIKSVRLSLSCTDRTLLVPRADYSYISSKLHLRPSESAHVQLGESTTVAASQLRLWPATSRTWFREPHFSVPKHIFGVACEAPGWLGSVTLLCDNSISSRVCWYLSELGCLSVCCCPTPLCRQLDRRRFPP